MYYVYVLQNKIRSQIYVGSTNDLRRRLAEHNQGKERSTKRYMPWKLIYYEAFNSESFARQREMKLKYNGNAMKELKKRIGLDLPSTCSSELEHKESPLHRGLGENNRLIKKPTGAGFTLIELLVVIGIIGVLSAGVIIAIDPVKQIQRAHDKQRITDLKQIQTALELYRADNGLYPANVDCAGGLTATVDGDTVTYLSEVPCDPKDNSTSYPYVRASGNTSDYTLTACFESDKDYTGSGSPCTNYKYEVTAP